MPRRPHGRRGTARLYARSPQSHDPLHHPPAALDGRAALRDQPPDLRDLLHAARGRPRGAARGAQPSPELLAVDPPHARPRQAVVHPVPEVPRPLVFHFDFGYSFQNNVSVKSQIFDRLPATAALAAGGAVVWLLVGIPIGIISADQARHVDGPRGHGHRARRDLGPGLLARPRLAVPLLQGPRQVPALRGPGRLSADRQHLHQPRRGHPGADHAVVRARRLVRRDLRALPARQPARDDVRGLHPDGAGEGPARAHASSSSTACARPSRRS